MWEPRRLITLWASTACYRDSFIFTRDNFTFYTLPIKSQLVRSFPVLMRLQTEPSISATMRSVSQPYIIGSAGNYGSLWIDEALIECDFATLDVFQYTGESTNRTLKHENNGLDWPCSWADQWGLRTYMHAIHLHKIHVHSDIWVPAWPL
jgi:hypothetical protein